MDRMPNDPIGSMKANAITLHEAYEAYVTAGFTPEQAMQIIITVIQIGVLQNGGDR